MMSPETVTAREHSNVGSTQATVKSTYEDHGATRDGRRYKPPGNNGTLAPPEAFDTERSNAAVRTECGLTTPPGETGRHSRTVRNRIARSCAGWPEQPTSEEFHDALRAREPTRRQQNLISMWMLEASNEDIILAWAEEAYTMRELVAAVHRAKAQDDNPARNAYLNSLATA